MKHREFFLTSESVLRGIEQGRFVNAFKSRNWRRAGRGHGYRYHSGYCAAAAGERPGRALRHARRNHIGHGRDGRRQRHELRRYHAASDVFVTTPWYEPFGITPLEAMACSRPVIGSAVGGIQYTVLPGVTGLLVPPRDPRALARRLLELQEHPAMAAAMVS